MADYSLRSKKPDFSLRSFADFQEKTARRTPQIDLFCVDNIPLASPGDRDKHIQGRATVARATCSQSIKCFGLMIPAVIYTAANLFDSSVETTRSICDSGIDL